LRTTSLLYEPVRLTAALLRRFITCYYLLHVRVCMCIVTDNAETGLGINAFPGISGVVSAWNNSSALFSSIFPIKAHIEGENVLAKRLGGFNLGEVIDRDL
jgi:hypothetical protein